MACFIISYDLPEGSDYDALISAIKAYGVWAHITMSTWAVVTEDNARTVRDELGALVPAGSRIIVVKSGVQAAWRNVICSNEWLKRNL
jgi:hypothetical protein